MLDDQSLIQDVRACPTREAATDQTKVHLANRGWFIAERDEFDVIAVHPDGSRMIIKFWIRADKMPVPKFYIKKFDQSVQAFIHDNNLKENVTVLFITNTVLDTDAFAYYRGFARFTMKVCFSGDIKEQLSSLQEQKVPKKKDVQKELMQYVAA
nr:hypothetical protein [Candidatus Sigynarchaeota archaeon]